MSSVEDCKVISLAAQVLSAKIELSNKQLSKMYSAVRLIDKFLPINITI